MVIDNNFLRGGAGNRLRPQQDDREEVFEESGGGGGGGSSSGSDGGRTGLACGSTPATGRWTKKEHDDFLVGLEACGKDWIEISCHFVFSRTATQIRTHAQKYFTKVNRGQSFPEQPYESVSGKRNTCDDRSGFPGEERHRLNRPPRSSNSCSSHSSSGESVVLSSRTRSGVAKRKHAALAQEEQSRKQHHQDQQHQERPHQELQHQEQHDHEDQHQEEQQREEEELQKQQDDQRKVEGLPGSTPNHPCHGLNPYPVPVPSPLAPDLLYPEQQSRLPGVEWPAPLHGCGGMTAWFKEPRVDAQHEAFGDECEQAFFTFPDVAECNFGSSPLSSLLEDTPGAEYFGVPPTDRHGAAAAIAAAAAAGDTAGGFGSRDGGSGADGGELDSTLAERRLGGPGGRHDWYPTEGWVDKQQEVLRVRHRRQQQQQQQQQQKQQQQQQHVQWNFD